MMKMMKVLMVWFCFFGFIQCTHKKAVQGPSQNLPYALTNQKIRGHTSWYGRPFHGRKTASGERYDMYKMTAAHKSLPLGTILKVKNLENDKTIYVKVNDRGPYIKGRVLDLSYAAAKELEFVRDGTTEVEAILVKMQQH